MIIVSNYKRIIYIKCLAPSSKTPAAIINDSHRYYYNSNNYNIVLNFNTLTAHNWM